MIEVTFNQNTLEYILILLVRVSGFVFISPFFGDSAIAARVKVSISVWISILLFYIGKATIDHQFYVMCLLLSYFFLLGNSFLVRDLDGNADWFFGIYL